MSDYSIYPRAIDGYAQIPLAVDKKSPINAESVNRLRSGIINIEKAIGIAPGFSTKFGEFPDLAGRISGVEDQLLNYAETLSDYAETIDDEISFRVSSLDIAEYFDELSLTELYLKEREINLSVGPIILSGESFLDLRANEDSSLKLSAYDNSHTIHSDNCDIFFSSHGLAPSTHPLISEWPRTVNLRASEASLMGVPGNYSDFRSYLSFGDSLGESELSIVKIESDSGGNHVAVVAGIGSSLDPTIRPVGLEILTSESEMPGEEGAGIRLSSANTSMPGVEGGKIYLDSGNTTDWKGVTATFEGATPSNGGGIKLRAGADSGGSGGGKIEIDGASAHSGGDVKVSAGSAGGELGEIRLHGRVAIESSLSLSIRRWTESTDGNLYDVGPDDYTIIVNADGGPVQVRLPNAALCSGRVCVVKKVDSLNSVVVSTHGGDIDASVAQTMGAQNQSITFQSNGGDWYIINSYLFPV